MSFCAHCGRPVPDPAVPCTHGEAPAAAGTLVSGARAPFGAAPLSFDDMPELVIPPASGAAPPVEAPAPIATSSSIPSLFSFPSQPPTPLAIPASPALPVVSLPSSFPPPAGPSDAAPPPIKRPPQQRGGGALDMFGSGVEFDGDMDISGIDVASDGGGPGYGSRGASSHLHSEGFSMADVGMEDEAPPEAPPSRRAGSRPAAPQQAAESTAPAPAIDPFEAQALADYGPAPTSAVAAPFYFVRVVMRRRALRAEAIEARDQAAKRAEEEQDALAAVTESLRVKLEADPNWLGLLAPVKAVEERAASRGEALQSASADLRARLDAIDAEASGVEGEIERGKVVEAELSEVVAGVADQLERVEGRVRRTDIEIRAAQTAARAASGPEATTMPPEHAARLATLSAERAERQAEVDRAAAALREARQPLDAQARLLASLDRKRIDLARKRKQTEDQYSRQISVRSEGVAVAHRERRDALAALAATLLSKRVDEVPSEVRARLDASRVAAAHARVLADTYAAAIGAFDREAFRRGAIGAGVAALAALALLAGLAAAVSTRPG